MEIKKMLSFHGDPAIKQKYVDRVKMHQKLDHIAKGVYYENTDGKIRACGVGCTIEGYDHTKYETELGIPKGIAYLEDTIFEGLPNKEAMKFPLQFLQAVPINTDLSHVIAKFVIWQWEDKKNGLKNIKKVQEHKETYGFCEEVVSLYKRTLTEEVSEDEFYALYKKMNAWAWAGATRAGARAGAGAEAWAEAGAWARAWARARAGARAWAGAEARAGAGARAGANNKKQYTVMSKQLIKIIKETV